VHSDKSHLNRRRFIRSSLGLALPAVCPNLAVGKTQAPSHTGRLLRRIPSTGETISPIGMGSWITYDIQPSGSALQTRINILKAFFDQGGQMIDSSPMYGRSEEVLGKCLDALAYPKENFSATKVWISGKDQGIAQMKNSQQLWGVNKFNLMQIHNLVDWQSHMKTLTQWKEQGKLQYIGITTYGGLQHELMEKIMENYPIDFVQLTYNIVDREAEKTLLPLAAKRNIAVIANRPFREGRLFNAVKGKQLPENAKDFCAIPATSQVSHMNENMGALLGKLPSEQEREAMASYL